MSHDPIAADIGTRVSDNALHGVTARRRWTSRPADRADGVSARSGRRRSSEGIQLLAFPRIGPRPAPPCGRRVQDVARTYSQSMTAPPASSPNRPPTHRRWE